MDREENKMSNKLISFLIFASIIFIALLFGLKPSKKSSEIDREIDKKNEHIVSLQNDIDSLKKKLTISFLTRVNYQVENKRLIKAKQIAINNEKKIKLELLSIQDKYEGISLDSFKVLLTVTREKERPDLSNEEWALEKNDSVKVQASLLEAIEKVKLEQDTLIGNQVRIISTYQDDSTLYNQVIVKKDSIIEDKDKIIKKKDEQIKPLKKKITFLGGLAILLGIIAIAK